MSAPPIAGRSTVAPSFFDLTNRSAAPIQPPPRFSDFQFKTIGQTPALLKRMSTSATARQDEDEDDSIYGSSPVSHAPSPDNASNVLPRSRASLYETWGTSSDVSMLAPGEAGASRFQDTFDLAPLRNAFPASSDNSRPLFPTTTDPSASSSNARNEPSVSSSPSEDGQPPSLAVLRALRTRLATTLTSLTPVDTSDAIRLAKNAQDQCTAVLNTAQRAHTLAQQALVSAQESMDAAQDCLAEAENIQHHVDEALYAVHKLGPTDGSEHRPAFEWNEALQTLHADLRQLEQWTVQREAHDARVQREASERAEERKRQASAPQSLLTPQAAQASPRISPPTNDESPTSLMPNTDGSEATDVDKSAVEEEVDLAQRALDQMREQAAERKRLAEEELRSLREAEEQLEQEQLRAEAATAGRAATLAKLKADRLKAEEEEKRKQEDEDREAEARRMEFEEKARLSRQARLEQQREQSRKKEAERKLAEEQEKAEKERLLREERQRRQLEEARRLQVEADAMRQQQQLLEQAKRKKVNAQQQQQGHQLSLQASPATTASKSYNVASSSDSVSPTSLAYPPPISAAGIAHTSNSNTNFGNINPTQTSPTASTTVRPTISANKATSGSKKAPTTLGPRLDNIRVESPSLASIFPPPRSPISPQEMSLGGHGVDMGNVSLPLLSEVGPISPEAQKANLRRLMDAHSPARASPSVKPDPDEEMSPVIVKEEEEEEMDDPVGGLGTPHPKLEVESPSVSRLSSVSTSSHAEQPPVQTQPPAIVTVTAPTPQKPSAPLTQQPNKTKGPRLAATAAVPTSQTPTGNSIGTAPNPATAPTPPAPTMARQLSGSLPLPATLPPRPKTPPMPHGALPVPEAHAQSMALTDPSSMGPDPLVANGWSQPNSVHEEDSPERRRQPVVARRRMDHYSPSRSRSPPPRDNHDGRRRVFSGDHYSPPPFRGRRSPIPPFPSRNPGSRVVSPNPAAKSPNPGEMRRTVSNDNVHPPLASRKRVRDDAELAYPPPRRPRYDDEPSLSQRSSMNNRMAISPLPQYEEERTRPAIYDRSLSPPPPRATPLAMRMEPTPVPEARSDFSNTPEMRATPLIGRLEPAPEPTEVVGGGGPSQYRQRQPPPQPNNYRPNYGNQGQTSYGSQTSGSGSHHQQRQNSFISRKQQPHHGQDRPQLLDRFSDLDNTSGGHGSSHPQQYTSNSRGHPPRGRGGRGGGRGSYHANSTLENRISNNPLINRLQGPN